MDRVFVLHHVRKDDAYGDDAKMIGAYRTEAAADAAIARLSKQPGFIEHPAGFTVAAYELDKDHWTEGFADLSGDSN